MSVLAQVLDELNRKIFWDREVSPKQLREFDSIFYQVRTMVETREKQMLECVVTLDVIAAWDMGAHHDGNIQQWNAAQLARQQLAALGITGPLNQEQKDERPDQG